MIRRTALTVMASGLCLALGGCVLATKEQVTTIPVPHMAGSALIVTAHNGHITVHTASGSQVQVVATLRMTSDERLATTTITANRDTAGALVIAATPPGGSWQSNEGCGFDVSLPDVQNATLKSNNGRIELAGASGAAIVKTSNGSISISRHSGSIDADTSNGRIEIDGASGPVKAETSNGSVRIVLGSGSAGPVNVETSNGAVTLQVASSFAGTISAKTSNGSISAPEARSGSTPISVDRSGRTQATVRIGTGGPDSSIRTSNGSITIRFAD